MATVASDRREIGVRVPAAAPSVGEPMRRRLGQRPQQLHGPQFADERHQLIDREVEPEPRREPPLDGLHGGRLLEAAAKEMLFFSELEDLAGRRNLGIVDRRARIVGTGPSDDQIRSQPVGDQRLGREGGELSHRFGLRRVGGAHSASNISPPGYRSRHRRCPDGRPRYSCPSAPHPEAGQRAAEIVLGRHRVSSDRLARIVEPSQIRGRPTAARRSATSPLAVAVLRPRASNGPVQRRSCG